MFEFDPFLPQFQTDPYPYYKKLREEYPAYYLKARDLWLISRYDDVMAILTNTKTWSSQANGNVVNDSPERIGRTLGTTDPPRHDELRRMLNSVFTPKSIQRLEPLVRENARELISDFAKDGGCDIMKRYIAKLTAGVIGYLLGIPKEDHDMLRGWTSARRFGDDGKFLDSRRQAEQQLEQYTYELVRRKEANPEDDLTSDLIRLRDQGENLDTPEIVMTCRTIISAAFESTNLMFGNVLNALSKHPDQLEEVIGNPELIPNAVEEAVRWDPSAQGFQRTTTVDVEIGGTVIPRGSKALVLYASANRDEKYFPDPDRFDIHRKIGRHLGFGWGPHICIGAPLARLEMKVGLEELFSAFGKYEIDYAESERSTATPQFRGYLKLYIKY